LEWDFFGRYRFGGAIESRARRCGFGNALPAGLSHLLDPQRQPLASPARAGKNNNLHPKFWTILNWIIPVIMGRAEYGVKHQVIEV